jgi:hypothetical protein
MVTNIHEASDRPQSGPRTLKCPRFWPQGRQSSGGGSGGGGGGGGGYGGGGRGGGGGGYGGGGGGYGGGARNGNGGNNGDAADARGGQPLRMQVGQTFHLRQTDRQLIVTEDNPDGPAMSSYTLDGKETTNTIGATTSKSKTKWDGVALVTDSTRTIDTGRDNGPGGGKFTIKTHEVRSLSEDGKTMTVMTTLDAGRGKQTTTATLEKVDD